MKKFLIPILIIMSFSIIIIVPQSLNICVPSGCVFNNQACSHNGCINETFMKHLSERLKLLNTTIALQIFIFFVITLIFLVTAQKNLEYEKPTLARFYIKQKLLNSTGIKLYNYLIKAFSSGIINPKIY